MGVWGWVFVGSIVVIALNLLVFALVVWGSRQRPVEPVELRDWTRG